MEGVELRRCSSVVFDSLCQDAIRAQHENGVLRVCIDKKERHESTARPIQITHDYPFCK